ncbi:uncharacterized protein LOC127248802 [Andrographis paniculata]|uniref:uncharacterized protein LOC127248802 n=1 Tax=Andrographis paniculata TaxID=175694 RepID=UPI0021E9739E|nr:uncharacterized protein LOC127248802 [Andrographis paniculata]
MLLVPVSVPFHGMFYKMYNQNSSDQPKGVGAPPMAMSPRISFSNDFVESSHHSQSHHHHHRPAAASYRDAPVSSDFEFSVSNYSMMSADELFFKGRLLPLKETSCSSSSGSFQKTTTTLRDELQNNEEDGGDDFSLRPPKNPTRWRGFLGLRKSHIGSKKPEKPLEKRTPVYGHHDDIQCTKNSQDFVE